MTCKNLDDIAAALQAELDEKEAVREVAIKSSRAIVRLCSSAIQAVHRGEAPVSTIAEAAEEIDRLRGIISEHPEMRHAGFVETAFQEWTEVRILQAVCKRAQFPHPDELNVTPQAYLEGMGDVVGEVRRLALARLMVGEMDEACRLLGVMEDIYGFLMRFDYPSALAGVKRKQDVARSLVEKTRGEIAVAVRTHALEGRLVEFERRSRKKRL